MGRGGGPGLWHTAVGAQIASSPETGLNGSSNPEALAMSRWKTAAQRMALCPVPVALGL